MSLSRTGLSRPPFPPHGLSGREELSIRYLSQFQGEQHSIANNTFTGSNNQGTSIYSYNTGTNVTICGNAISASGTGIRCYYSNAFLTSNSIQNNWNYGIQADNLTGYPQYRSNHLESNGCNLLLNASSPWVMHNTILGGSPNVVANVSTPNFATLSGEGDNQHGHNTFRYGGFCLLKAQNSSFPYLGYSSGGGYNSLYDIDLFHLQAENNSGIYADNNYWGGGGAEYTVDGTSWVLARYPLGSNPNQTVQELPIFRAAMKTSSRGLFLNATAESDTLESTFRQALDLIQTGQVASAKEKLRLLIDENSGKYSPLAILLFYDLTKREQETSPSRTAAKELSNLLMELHNEPKDQLLRPFAVRLLAREAGLAGDFATAKNYREELVRDYPSSPHEVAAFYDQIVQYVEVEDNRLEAKILLERMKEAYPEDDLTTAARILLGEQVIWNIEKQKSLQSAQEETSEFRLHGAFPNPFNPVTTLSFELPDAGHVSLQIYDLLGREIARLLHGELTEGFHSVLWDASNQSSGIFLARMQANGKSAVLRLILLK